MLGSLCTKYMPWLVASVHTFALSVRVQNIARDACFGLSRLRLRLSLWRDCGKHKGRERVQHYCICACTRVATVACICSAYDSTRAHWYAISMHCYC